MHARTHRHTHTRNLIIQNIYPHFFWPCFSRWLKDGQLIDERDGFKTLLNGRKLVIAQAQVSDTGLYRCVAANPAGSHKKEFEVTVHGRLEKGQGHYL